MLHSGVVCFFAFRTVLIMPKFRVYDWTIFNPFLALQFQSKIPGIAVGTALYGDIACIVCGVLSCLGVRIWDWVCISPQKARSSLVVSAHVISAWCKKCTNSNYKHTSPP